MASASNSSSASTISIADADPVTRNALRYTISAKEYDLLHKYIISRSPALEKRTPPPKQRQAPEPDPADYNAATVRLSLRLALTSYAGLKLYDVILERFLARAVEP